MLRNYIIVALRHFKRNHVTSIINVLGLTLGLATCLVAGLYIKHDLTADKFHTNASSIFHVTVHMNEYIMSGTPYLFAETAAKEIPEVKGMLRTAEMETTLRINDEIYKHEVIFSDSNLLTFFTFPLAEGNVKKALSGLRQVVISHDMKEKYFPKGPALGQRIGIEFDKKFEEFEISGVAEPTPAHSSMYFDFAIPLENRYTTDQSEKNDWNRYFLTTFLLIDPDKKNAVEKAMPAFVTKHFPADTGPQHKLSANFLLNSYADHYLNNQFGGGGLRNGKSAQSLIVFGGIAIVILLLACFNFMNLANAQSSRRAVEVGVKKVVGAVKGQLVRQFLAEAMVMSILASILALGLAELALFLFRDLLQMDISFFNRNNLDIYLGLAGVTALTGLLAGTYPALVLANLQTLKTFKRQFKIGGSNWITRSILSLQFGISIILIVCAIVMWKQQQFVTSSDLGFNRDQVVAVAVPGTHAKSMDFLKSEIEKLGEVATVTKTTTNFNGQSAIVHHTGKDGKSSFLYLLSADEDFVSTMQMQLVQGEGFKEGQPENAIMVNEALVKELDLQDSIGVTLGRQIGATSKPVIVGVLKDFHHAAMKYKIGPMVVVYNQPLGDGYLLARLEEKQMASGVEKIRALWEKAMPDTPLDFSFVDDNVQKQYEAETRWSTIITLATIMAIFLSILGLLGLAMFTAEQRKKEISIRKVMGASVMQLVNLLSRDYVWLILAAFAISIPVSWYLMNNYWLNNFAYKTDVDVAVYVVALIVVMAIAAISVGSQTVRAALKNPAETLKEE
jgi:putative ABC transport system permease protein